MAGTNLARIKNKKIQSNNTSGHNGVSWHRRKEQWYARINFKGRNYSLGYYDRISDAIFAREEAEKMTFDQFIEKMKKKKIIEI